MRGSAIATLDEVLSCLPADDYVLIEDKARILDAVKKALRECAGTIFRRQVHFGHDPSLVAAYPAGQSGPSRLLAILSIATSRIFLQEATLFEVKR